LFRKVLHVAGKNDRRATIVIEHIIHVSDIAHTVRHWHMYRKWNERLYQEMYAAYKVGRILKNGFDFGVGIHGEIVRTHVRTLIVTWSGYDRSHDNHWVAFGPSDGGCSE